jgi:NHL repeat
MRGSLAKAFETTRSGRMSVPLVVCALVLALGGAPAHAAPKGTIGFLGEAGSGAGAGQFMDPRGVAVNQTTGHVYVVDSSNHRIQQFDAMGNFVRTWGRGVRDGAPAAQVCAAPGPCGAGTAGSLGGELSNPQGIAIDQDDGSVYVTEQGNLRVQKFSDEGVFQRAWGRGVATGAANTEVCLAAASCRAGTSGPRGGEFAGSGTSPFSGHPTVNPATRNVVVPDPGNRRVQEFNPDGGFVRTWGWDVQTGGVTTFEVCSVASSCKIAASNGSNVGRFGTNQPTRVAVDATGAVYTVEGPSGTVSDGNWRVQRFGPSSGSPPLMPAVFADDVLNGTSDESSPLDVTVDPVTNNVLVVKANAAPAERRIVELTVAGDLVETHLQGAGVSSMNGIAVHGSGDRVYVSIAQGGDHRVLMLGTVTALPSATSAPVTDVTATSATFHGTVNPNGGAVRTGWHFEYSDDGGFTWARVPASDQDVGNGTDPVDVHQPVTGLEPNTAYQVRLVARRQFAGGSATSLAQDFTTPAAPPEVSGVTTREVTDTTALLLGEVDPNHSHTTYRFEYGTDTNYGSTTAVDNAGSGAVDVVVSKAVTGLQPNTTYHFRLVATNAAGETGGSDQTFTTDADPPQSSGRVYEMVSPVDKNNGDIDRDLMEGCWTQSGAAASGEAAAFLSRVAFAGIESGTLKPNYIARRAATGWTTEGISPPIGNFDIAAEVPCVLGLSQDVSKAYVRTGVSLTPDASRLNGSWGLYIRRVGEAERYSLLSSPSPALFEPPNQPPAQDTGSARRARFTFVADTPDSRHVVFHSSRRLLPGPGVPSDSNSVNAVYEWVDGSLRLASVLPGGLSATEVHAGRLTGNGQGIEDNLRGDHIISDDGRRVFFTAELEGNLGVQLFVRENGATTTAVSASERPEDDPPGDGLPLVGNASADFFGAKGTDGSVAFFRAVAPLTPGAANNSVYRWDANAPEGERLTVLAPGSTMLGLPVAISDDARSVYFVATGELAQGARPDEPNLYLWRQGQGLRYIATLEDIPGETDINWPDQGMWAVQRSRSGRAARLSADGERLLFASYAPLDPAYDPTEASANACGDIADGGDHCRQIYLYDSPSGRLSCLTCVPGVPVTGDANLFGNSDTRRPTGSGEAAIQAPSLLPRNLSADGTRAFFETARPLVSADRNSRLDVYEWEDRDRDGQGELRLISPGRGNSDSKFLDASLSGDDVFFTTREQLVGIDIDNQVDLYDARVGGGIPAQNPAPVAQCGGDECQGALSGAPFLPGVGSVDSSHGDLRPRRRPSFSVARLSRRQRAQLAHGRRVMVRVRVTRAGTVRLAARAKVAGRMRTVARASKRVRRGGTVRLPVKLSRTSLRELAGDGRLNVRLAVRFTGVRETRVSTLRLRRTNPSGERRAR